MKNGIVELIILKLDGFVIGIFYYGVNNLLESYNEDYDWGYM